MNVASKYGRKDEYINSEAQRITSKLLIDVMDRFPSTADINIDVLEKRFRATLKKEIYELKKDIEKCLLE